jgi:hypothetical protein
VEFKTQSGQHSPGEEEDVVDPDVFKSKMSHLESSQQLKNTPSFDNKGNNFSLGQS